MLKPQRSQVHSYSTELFCCIIHDFFKKKRLLQ